VKKIAVLGISGMLGNAVYSEMKNGGFDVSGITRDDFDCECADLSQIKNVLRGYDYVINCICFIKQHINETKSSDIERAVKLNALFPHLLVRATDAKIIQIATDCVFDGAKGGYVETDKHNALDVYGKTKSLGEVDADNFINIRCSIVGPEIKNKLSMLEWFLGQEKNARVSGYKNHLWNGVTTKTFAKICAGIIKNDYKFNKPLQHLIPADIVSKNDMLKIFAKHFCREDIVITALDAEQAVNRTLNTINAAQNTLLWEMAGYDKIPEIEKLIKEMDCKNA
jgi:dTDP-4-dehydrorhamnose reductase